MELRKKRFKVFLCQPILHGFKQGLGMASSKMNAVDEPLFVPQQRTPAVLSPNSLLSQGELIYFTSKLFRKMYTSFHVGHNTISVAPCSKQFSLFKLKMKNI